MVHIESCWPLVPSIVDLYQDLFPVLHPTFQYCANQVERRISVQARYLLFSVMSSVVWLYIIYVFYRDSNDADVSKGTPSSSHEKGRQTDNAVTSVLETVFYWEEVSQHRWKRKLSIPLGDDCHFSTDRAGIKPPSSGCIHSDRHRCCTLDDWWPPRDSVSSVTLFLLKSSVLHQPVYFSSRRGKKMEYFCWTPFTQGKAQERGKLWAKYRFHFSAATVFLQTTLLFARVSCNHAWSSLIPAVSDRYPMLAHALLDGLWCSSLKIDFWLKKIFVIAVLDKK